MQTDHNSGVWIQARPVEAENLVDEHVSSWRHRTYIQTARPAKLGAAMYLQLCQVFCEIGQLEDAQRLVSVLVEKCPQLAEISAALHKLAAAFAERENHKACDVWLDCLCSQYPLSSEARIAQQRFER